MPNPPQITAGKSTTQYKGVTYDVLLISRSTGCVRAILAEGLESMESLDTVKVWGNALNTKFALVKDHTSGKHKIGDIFKGYDASQTSTGGYFPGAKKEFGAPAVTTVKNGVEKTYDGI
jgi:hypothetical protein